MAKSTAFQAVNVGSNPITRCCNNFNLFKKIPEIVSISTVKLFKCIDIRST